jgi:cytochrome c553
MTGARRRLELAGAGLAAALTILLATKPALGTDVEAITKKAEVCVACHGPDGNSANPVVPSLAGQPKQFVTTQLVMFREGIRKDPVMSPQSANLSNADIDDLGTYFSAKTLTAAGKSSAPDKAVAGRGLAERFRCVQCHGPALTGQQHIPRLAGQQPEYLRTQLRGFKASTRFDMDGNMTSAAQPLSDADIEILADYLAGLQQGGNP